MESKPKCIPKNKSSLGSILYGTWSDCLIYLRDENSGIQQLLIEWVLCIHKKRATRFMPAMEKYILVEKNEFQSQPSNSYVICGKMPKSFKLVNINECNRLILPSSVYTTQLKAIKASLNEAISDYKTLSEQSYPDNAEFQAALDEDLMFVKANISQIKRALTKIIKSKEK